MASCTASDEVPKTFGATALTARAMPLSTSREDCPKERYCDEVEHGRPQCPPGRCRYRGKEHDKIPCPDHDRPFGVDLAAGGRASAKTAAKRRPKRRPKKTAGRRKVAVRGAPRRKASKKTKAKKPKR